MRSLLPLCIVLNFGLLGTVSAQDSILAAQLPEVPRYGHEVVDPVYGIEMYEPLNFQLDGDSMRNCDGYACQAWIEDRYKDGAILHKGYYLDGQLKVYKNFYPNGAVEREFKNLDSFRSLMRKFHSNGQLKSEVRYVEGNAIEWADYYKDGQLEYFEQYNKGFDYHLERKSYFKSGKPQELFAIDNRKKLLFTQQEFFENGQIKSDGMIKYDQSVFDFYKIGKWAYYDENGNLTKEETYNKGALEKEEVY
jgi:antitoxin component YwqK of YwqJK toxin-antitoxin module